MNKEYLAAAHAMQSGVAMDIEMNGEVAAGANPKHLRVGVNSAMVENSALWGLLLKKGIITEEEMTTALVEAHQAEAARYEAHLSAKLGKKVKLA